MVGATSNSESPVTEQSRTMQKLIFVYNGDSGLFNGVMHYLHKRISPDTYPCQLCGIIYDGTELNKGWRSLKSSAYRPSFCTAMSSGQNTANAA